MLAAASEAENVFGASCITPNSASTIRSLAELDPDMLAVMHGSSVTGDCNGALLGLADDFEHRLLSSTETAMAPIGN